MRSQIGFSQLQEAPDVMRSGGDDAHAGAGASAKLDTHPFSRPGAPACGPTVAGGLLDAGDPCLAGRGER